MPKLTIDMPDTVRPLSEALDELDRELKIRERCYDRWVKEGRLSATDAKDRGERMTAAVDYLKSMLVALAEGPQ